MGMDLVAANEGVESFHANWTLWGMLSDLLIQLECDLQHWSGSNDGHFVPEEDAAEWGQRVLGSLDSIEVWEFKSHGIFGGVRTQWHVPGAQASLRQSPLEELRVSLRQALSGDAAGLNAGPAQREAAPVVVPLSHRPDDRQLLESFAQFCLESGGFEQY